MTTSHATPARSGFGPRLTESDCDLADFASVVSQTTDLADYPHAAEVQQNVLLFDAAALRAAVAAGEGDTVEAELVRALTDGPGVVVLRGAFDDLDVVDRATATFDRIIDAEAAAGRARSDHFAQPGANSRVWNALEKLALEDPETFVDYYANDMLALVSHAWLGPGYQVTSQVNVVRPGGVAQDPHRDYHLGFLSNDTVAQYPTHVHTLSPVLTLQGAVAHSDMPVESGPTLYLPYSHQYVPGYLAWRLPEFRAHFADHHVQLPLAKGDAGFFNPALFHGAGSNVSTDVQRMANLLQVSSAFGRAMETVDRAAVSTAVFPALAARKAAGWDADALARVIASSAEGYPFPTNLDRDANVDGLTPLAQSDLLQQGLDEGWGVDRMTVEIDACTVRHATDAG
jgi:ectoine hydroxylase-related dioxygenase (phytanoyl-CoA dioxygenase family)